MNSFLLKFSLEKLKNKKMLSKNFFFDKKNLIHIYFMNITVDSFIFQAFGFLNAFLKHAYGVRKKISNYCVSHKSIPK
jgi:hypothetical protein